MKYELFNEVEISATDFVCLFSIMLKLKDISQYNKESFLNFIDDENEEDDILVSNNINSETVLASIKELKDHDILKRTSTNMMSITDEINLFSYLSLNKEHVNFIENVTNKYIKYIKKEEYYKRTKAFKVLREILNKK